MLTSKELRERGGHWIGAARSWIQRTFVNGESVTWGSDEALRGGITPKKIEDLAECVALAYANHDMPEQQSAEFSDLNMRLVLAFGWIEPNKSGRDLIQVAKDEIIRLREELAEAKGKPGRLPNLPPEANARGGA